MFGDFRCKLVLEGQERDIRVNVEVKMELCGVTFELLFSATNCRSTGTKTFQTDS